jgi:ribosomal protein S12 methylthiotransferase accessory factor YcaO
LNVEGRIQAHRDGKEWWTEVQTIELAHFASRSAAVAAEREAIRRECPAYNVIHAVRPGAQGVLGQMEGLGARYKPALAEVKALREELSRVVPIAILDHGVTEYAAARDTGIDRMAIRTWVKKERDRRAEG